VPGVFGMTLLFGSMLAALSTVNDKESGVMRMLVIAPFAHGWIVLAKTAGAIFAAIVQAVMLLVVLLSFGFMREPISWPLFAAGLFATALACASFGMLIAAWSKTLDNYATLMNLVIFPMFFLSGSLYPIQRLPGALRLFATINPYTYGTDLLRHAAITGADNSAFSIGVDFSVIGVFSVAALALAAARFSRDNATESLLHRPARI
jgi:ABC-2 type transport system permease protein